MGVKTGTVAGVMHILRNPNPGNLHLALVTFSMPAFGSGDTGTLAVRTAIQDSLRNGKAVTLKAALSGPEGVGFFGGAGTNYYVGGTVAVSSGNITYSMTAVDLTTAVASPNSGAQSVGTNPGDYPLSMLVSYTEA
jgi:hypothetical protein